MGQNPKKVVLSCSVVHTVPVRSAVPLVYVCMDSQGQFFALTIYGLEVSQEKALSHSKNKTLQVVGPMFNVVDLTWQNRTFNFPSIRVNQVGTLLVEGQPITNTGKGGAQSINCMTTVMN